ncbi:tetratricopeptide repeat-containing sulfotransferase family protein [Aurantiacibacter aquimixticola]|uniref:Sulfotransferase family protein n=1 Tax=Aurantiacibacter aquimixticola TaxID=1958945 RepID=A0A419RRD3_9SPHN|nr:tetratricopeptide repeat-containing sulfotransferase family protein [Aurantiacibacter aquimixticola]RJY08329.1 sulfotransferase family protein [Aurantiacibacter aquimixticola]
MDAEARLAAAQSQIKDGAFAAALETLAPLLAEEPPRRDALYMQAVALRYAARPREALTALQALKAASPDYGRAWQEEGHVYLATGRTDTALEAYRYATHCNPTLIASWERQIELLRQSGDVSGAQAAARQLAHVKSLPPAVLAASNHLHEGRLLKAEELARAFLKRHPRHVEAMRVLAEVGARLNIIEDAAFLLESALAFEPGNAAARLDYIQILRKQQRYEEAMTQARILHESDPTNPVFQSNLAIEAMHNNRFEEAFALFDEVLEKRPGDPATLTSRGHALKTFGQQDEAVESYRAAIRTMSQYGDAWFGLANLKTYRFTDDEVATMDAQEKAEGLPHQARVQLNFALGKALDDRQDYDRSFAHYERGNALKRAASRYDADQMSAEFQAQRDVCTPDLFARHEESGHPAPDPIFIVGLPRSGSTLLEQILASHSQVDGTLELPNILSLAHRLRRRKRVTEVSQYPQILHDLSPNQLQTFGEKYIEDTRIHRQGAPFFIDKMPNNFRHIGLIKLILPNAKIIDARREPMACCFSGFKQLFAEGQEFTYGLTEIGRYYHDYVELMRHWHGVLPGAICHVQYEDVVADTDAQVRRILDYLGLPFEDACVAFHKTERAVRTASSEQVRQPINTKGLAAWKPFEPWLDPLKDALGSALENYRL